MPFVPDPARAVLDVVRSYPGPLARLAALYARAGRRDGFRNSDGGFGVYYPHEAEESESEIPAGYVRVYGFWGPPDGYELDVPERLYLDTLAEELERKGLTVEAVRVRTLTPAPFAEGA